MRAGLRWPVALVASAGVHAGAVGLILAVSEIAPVEQQPVPEARIEMAAHAVPGVEATEAEPDSDAVAQGAAGAARLPSASVPESRASALQPAASVVAEAVARADPVAAVDGAGEAASAVRPDAAASPVAAAAPAIAALALQNPAAESGRPVATPGQAVKDAPLSAQVAAAVAAPGQALDDAPVVGDTAAAVTAAGQVLANAPLASDAAAAVVAQGTEAQAADLPAETMGARAPAASSLASALLPSGAAQNVVPDRTDPVAATLPETASLGAERPQAAPAAVVVASASLARPSAPDAQAIVDTSAPAPVLAAVVAAGRPAPSVAPPRAEAPAQVPETAGLAGVSPVREPVAAVAASGVELAGLAPEAAPAPGVEASASRVPAATPQTDALVARLAWSGGAGAEMSAVSLAAIQSFLQEGDIAAGVAVRDGIEGLLASVPCSRIQAAFIPETGQLELRGHIPEDGLRGPVLAALQAQMGADIPVSDNLLILPRPQCGALAGIAAVGLPQSTDQDTNPLLVGPSAHASVYAFRAGQRLTFPRSQAPDYASYIYLDYFDAAGQVIHLAPNERVPLERFEPKVAIAFAPDSAAGRILDVAIGPPFGQEIAVAFAASHAVYGGVRPLVEPAGPYLDFLRDRIAERRAAEPDFKGEWVYFFVATGP